MSEKVYRSELTPVSFLRRSAYVFPEKTAVVYGERRYSDAELEELLADVGDIEIVRIDDTGEAGDPYEDYLAEGSPEPVPDVVEDEEETISINYTSGTTGRPKGVMYTCRGAYLSALGNAIEIGMGYET